VNRKATLGAGLLAFAWISLAPARAVADGGAANHPGPETLTVFAASSLQEAFRELGTAFEKQAGASVRFSFAGSQELRAQLEQGAQADVFASADRRHADALLEEKLATAPRSFAYNTLVIAVPKGNPEHIKELADLTRLKHLVIGAREVPVGLYSDRLFAMADAKDPSAQLEKKLLARVASRELNVRQVLAKVSLGEADAGIVYATDARAMSPLVDAVSLPPDLEQRAEDVITPLVHSSHPALAATFIAFVFSREGQGVLAQHGFRPVNAP
jgi:molybdate transport system substrate-binding protein